MAGASARHGEEENTLLPPKPGYQRGAADGSGKPSPPGSWASTALVVITATVLFTIWTLPSPTFSGKVNLFRQSWHLSEVLQEVPKLRAELEVAQKAATSLRTQVASKQSQNDEVQKRVAEKEKVSAGLKKQLEDARQTAAGLRGKKGALEKRLEDEQNKMKKLQDELKRIKSAEFPLLNEIPDRDKDFSEDDSS